MGKLRNYFSHTLVAATKMPQKWKNDFAQKEKKNKKEKRKKMRKFLRINFPADGE